MSSVFGIINFAGNNVQVSTMQSFRPVAAFSFLGRYRIIDFPVSNMSNSGIDTIQVYARLKPRSLVEHLGTGRHYNINSKRGSLNVLFAESEDANDIYNTDIAAYIANLDVIEHMDQEYVVIAPSYMICNVNYRPYLKEHIKSGADITLMYHATKLAQTKYLNCQCLNLNRQQGVLSYERNRGSVAERNIFMDTYVMKTELFLKLVKEASALSSMYTLADIVNKACSELDVRAYAYEGFLAAITDFPSYYRSNIDLIDLKNAKKLFSDDWPIYTRTNDSCPTQYFAGSSVKNSVISNGCLIEGTVENSIIGRGCTVKKGAVIKNSVVNSDVIIGEDTHVENMVVDKYAQLLVGKEIVAPAEKPGYVKRGDRL